MTTNRIYYENIFKKIDENYWQLSKNYIRPINSITIEDFTECLKEDDHFFTFLYFAITEKHLPQEHENFYSAYSEWLNSNEYKSPYLRKEVELIFSSATLLLKPRDIELFDHFADCIQYPIAYPFFFERLGVDREEWINNLIWQDKERTKLHPYLAKYIKPNQLGYKIIIYLIQKFYLPRYDYKSVKLLISQIDNNDTDNNKSNSLWNKIKYLYHKSADKVHGILKSYLYVLTLSIPLAVLIFTWLYGSFGWSWFDQLPIMFTTDNFSVYAEGSSHLITNVSYNSLLSFCELLTLIIIGVVLYKAIKKPIKAYKLSPRLFIGIIVGYIPIMAESTFWNLGISSSLGKSIWLIFILTISSFTFTYLYLRFEVRKGAEGCSDSVLRERTLYIFSRGIIYSFMLGLFLVDIFSSVYLRSSINVGVFDDLQKAGRFHAAIFGIMDPLMLLFYFPLALFIGVVIQFIWEEKPITHPIK